MSGLSSPPAKEPSGAKADEGPRARMVTQAEEVSEVARELASSERIAFDLESNGLFAYRARVCALQLGRGTEVTVIDSLVAPLAPLLALLGESGPVKIVHDVAFDARLLAEAGIALGNCHDTSIAARMLGRTATGLATLLLSELGVTVDKSMQQHDWSRRPFDERALTYLASDVVHLEKLDDVIWGAVRAVGIEDEVLCETRYRLSCAILSAGTPEERPPYVRIKGIERAPNVDLAILRRLADVREAEAARVDVAPYKIIGNEVLIAIAKAKPSTHGDLVRIRAATLGRASGISKELLRAVAAGIADGNVPDKDRIWLERPVVPTVIAKARRTRETRLMAWRKAEALLRGVDEQAILPGHCVKDIGEDEITSEDELAKIPGIGAFRVQRYGEAILKALVTAVAAPPPPPAGGPESA